MDLQKRNSVLCSFLLYFLRPQGNMYLTDVSLAQEEHTDTGLSDTAADGVWKLLVQDGFLEWKLSSVIGLSSAVSSTRIPMEESSRAMSSTG